MAILYSHLFDKMVLVVVLEEKTAHFRLYQVVRKVPEHIIPLCVSNRFLSDKVYS